MLCEVKTCGGCRAVEWCFLSRKLEKVLTGQGQTLPASFAMHPLSSARPALPASVEMSAHAPSGSTMLVPAAGFCFKGQRDRWIEVPWLRLPCTFFNRLRV